MEMNRTFQGILVAAVPVVVGLAFTVGILKFDLSGALTDKTGADTKAVATATAPGGSSSSSADATKAFVKSTCESCHGADLNGAYGPNLHEKAKQLSVAEIADVLKNGKNGKMPAGLAKGKEDEVAKYIKSLAN